MKKVLALLTAVLLLGSMTVVCVGAQTGEAINVTTDDPFVDFIVDVESGRSPRILQISDPQIIDPSHLEPDGESNKTKLMKDMEERCFRYIRRSRKHQAGSHFGCR